MDEAPRIVMTTLDDSGRERVLDLARAAVAAQVRGGARPRVPSDLAHEVFGAFVSLHRGDDLRGCLGTLDGPIRLAGAVARLAASVCHEDPRFPPVALDELVDLVIEVSVLTPPRLVVDVAAVEVGRHGLIVEQRGRKGLLLPQVAPEHGWDREALLMHTCRKAGLPGDAWRRGADIYRFEAEVFGGPFDRPGR
jgi:AmmeMemoRadiSam system protein A